MNKLSIIVDHYLDLTHQDDTDYARHLRGAKELLELCDGDVEKAKGILTKVSKKLIGLDWSIYQGVKRYLEVN